MATEAIQDYLKAIHQIQSVGVPATTNRIASRLAVSPASVSAMLRKLDDKGLVEHVKYSGVLLTARGRAVAVEIIRHHRLLELYLEKVIGMPWDKVHDEAEVLEHVISEDLESRLDELLGFPTTDPHGHPIPSRELGLNEATYPSLAELKPGRRGIVRSVSDSSAELLRHLDTLGLKPGAKVRVLESVPFGGGVRTRVGRTEHIVGVDAAQAVSCEEVA